MITMTQLAKLANVSQPTVSRVLSGSARVSPELRERVLACAREHDFQPNALARSLQGKRTGLLGVLAADLSNSFFTELAAELEAAAGRRGWNILLFNGGRSPERERACLDAARRYRVDGVLAAPLEEAAERWAENARRLDVPMVSVAQRAEGFDSVYVDQGEAGSMVARHLVERGFRRFLFVGAEGSGKYGGFRRTLGELGLAEKLEAVPFEDDAQLGKALEVWFRRMSFRTGIFAENDVYALKLLNVLRELGVPVPRRAGVIGFDNTYIGRYLNPQLSSVSQPVGQMAERAVERLLELLEGPERAGGVDLVLPAELVIREST